MLKWATNQMANPERVYTEKEAKLISRGSRRQEWRKVVEAVGPPANWIELVLSSDRKLGDRSRKRLERAQEGLIQLLEGLKKKFNEDYNLEEVIGEEEVIEDLESIEKLEGQKT